MKKGFTLIELLAVILILGIIALIAIPTINKILTEAREGSFKATLNQVIKAVENKCTLNQIKNMDITKGYIISNGIILPNIEIKGELPDGIIAVDNNCGVSFELYNNNFTGYKDTPESDIIIVHNEKNKYKDLVLNGADPIIDMGMIPIIIDNNGIIKKADIYSDWYNYTEKRWANVVLVSDEKRHDYKMANAGTSIDMNDIMAFYVWVPRYKYQIFTDVDNYEYLGSVDPNNYINRAKLINIRFENISSNKSNGKEVGNWLTHPAFTFGDRELNGLWIGKFETTGTNLNPTVLPYDSRTTKTSNMQSLRSQKTSIQFETSKKINYGLNALEPSMLKNTEWGAMAYLTSSIYGLGTTEVMINNSSLYNTGCGATVYPTKTAGAYINQQDHSEGHYYGCENEWYTLNGAKASTNGNFYGIYDTAGGSWEYMMSILEDSLGSGIPASGNNEVANSGFSGMLTGTLTNYYGTSFPNSKYYDVYKYGANNSDFSTRGLFGDGTIELDGLCYWQDDDGMSRNHTGWHKDYGKFVYNNSPWMTRSGSWYDGASAGLFAFDHANGYASGNLSFRSVIR